MVETVKLLIAVFSFGRELFSYLRKKEQANKICALKVKGVTDELKIAKDTKDTSQLESSFRHLFEGEQL